MTIVGGCFAVQNNIKSCDLYHSLLNEQVFAKTGNSLKINIIRYERFKSCFEKIKSYKKNNPIDILLFHIRTEQYLRLSKLYYKYQDEYGKIKRSLILPFMNKVAPEEYDLLQLNMPATQNEAIRESFIHRLSVKANYICGFFSGNRKYAVKLYDDLVSEIISFCKAENIKLVLAGPGSRPRMEKENELSGMLNDHFKERAEQIPVPYAELFGYYNDKNEFLFFPNGTHVNEKGHIRASNLTMNELIKNSYI